MDSKRSDDMTRFYKLLSRLQEQQGGLRLLENTSGRQSSPTRGVYYFFEPGELSSRWGTNLRVVRVGTHGLKQGSKSSLWGRLKQHAGSRNGAGNHRGSIFRLLVGDALSILDPDYSIGSWGKKNVSRIVSRQEEAILEKRVSKYIRMMPYLTLAVDDQPGPNSMRGYIERNTIALLSNYEKESLDISSPGWLGRYSSRKKVKQSGLWNNRHVHERYNPEFLDKMSDFIEESGK